MPKASVVIPSFNRADLLPSAVGSVLTQTMSDLELIVIDDGSTDETRTACVQLSASDSRIRYLYQDNQGLPAARNAGIRAAQGEYVAFLDADDCWMPTKLEKQLAMADKVPSAGLVYCDYACIDKTGRTWLPTYCENVGQTLYESLLYFNVIHGSASAVLIRKECFDQVGMFDETLRSLEDWDMWIRLAQSYECAKVPEVLVYLLQHEAQMQRKSLVMAESQIVLGRKVSQSIPSMYRHRLARVLWHYQLIAADLYCETSKLKCWRALAIATRSWPKGMLSPRPWYILVLSLTGSLYPQVNAAGLIARRWCRHYLGLGSITGGHERTLRD